MGQSHAPVASVPILGGFGGATQAKGAMSDLGAAKAIEGCWRCWLGF